MQDAQAFNCRGCLTGPASLSAAVAADLPRSQPPPPQPVLGKAPIGKFPVGKTPIGKTPTAPGPIITKG